MALDGQKSRQDSSRSLCMLKEPASKGWQHMFTAARFMYPHDDGSKSVGKAGVVRLLTVQLPEMVFHTILPQITPSACW